MPPKSRQPSQSSSSRCKHAELTLVASQYAPHAGYHSRTPAELQDALSALPRSGEEAASSPDNAPPNAIGEDLAYARPLVLPGDDLAEDPDWPAQSVIEWLNEPERNPVTSKRRTIYVAEPPECLDENALFINQEWIEPHSDLLPQNLSEPPKSRGPGSVQAEQPNSSPRPDTSRVIEYLQAYFHGMIVKPLPFRFSFSLWEDDESTPPGVNRSRGSKPTAKKQKLTHKVRKEPSYIGLRTEDEVIRVATRSCPDGLFPRQLGLNDLLDGAVAALPADAYTLLMLVNHDIYEDEDDDFACGRAYGGSRIAVVSTARYDPILDETQGVTDEDAMHAWPASHCRAYVQECCKAFEATQRKSKKQKGRSSSKAYDYVGRPSSKKKTTFPPLEMAVAAHNHVASEPVPQSLNDGNVTTWLSRVCRTASHELGHCFGMDHCVYFACNMQGTSSLVEDLRQPPYLCPVDTKKLSLATNTSEHARDQKLLEFCEKFGRVPLFNAYAGFLREKLSL